MGINIIEKNVKKYIDGEEVLYIYEPDIYIFRLIIFFIVSILIFLAGKNQIYNLDFIWTTIFVGVVFMFFLFLMRDIKVLLRGKLYIIKNKFIMYSGLKININEIYFLYTIEDSLLSFDSLIFYKNNNNFLFYCKANKDNHDFNDLIKILYSISENENILLENKNFRKIKEKLIKEGIKNGR